MVNTQTYETTETPKMFWFNEAWKHYVKHTDMHYLDRSFVMNLTERRPSTRQIFWLTLDKTATCV